MDQTTFVRTARRPLVGILLKMGSVAFFVVMFALIKASGDVPAGQSSFFRSFFAVVPVFIMLGWRGQILSAVRTRRPWSHVGRSAAGIVSMWLNFYGVTVLPLPDAVMLSYAQPLIIVVFSALLFGETVRFFRWSAVLVGLFGVVVIAWPKLSLFTGDSPMGDAEALGVVALLAGAVFSAMAMLQVRRLVDTENSATIVIWFSLVGAGFCLLTYPLGWADLSLSQTVMLVSSGIVAGIGQVMMTESYRHADMSTIAPFEYTSAIVSIILGWLIFSDLPTLHTVVGGAIVVGSGIFIIWREQQLGLERARARQVSPPEG